ncbi:TonB-dependent receptor [Aquincola sp. MAHUQ-54]|uniref:TonB-dependent receptor n=1 Tax=Aquincola agrisoli TaxID=3119538 RepID=A0AAW9QKV6_9BURK
MLAIGPLQAQPQPQPAPAVPAPASPSASEPGASPPDGAAQRIEVTGTVVRGDTELRRQSTASKIVVGREEIERFGDGNVSDVLKRIPGITVQGTPGRGGTPRMRGLGSGYTQILVDGEPLPAGFSVDSLSPEQLERIEVLRGPTAETGARAIAGTINIVTRETQRKPLNDWRLTALFDGGYLSPTVAWTRSDRLGEDFDYTSSLSLYAREDETRSINTTVSPTIDQRTRSLLHDQRLGLRGSGRLRWRLGEGESLTLSPFVVLTSASPRREGVLQQTRGEAPYERFESVSDSSFRMLRLNSQLNRRLGESRVEWKAGASHWRWPSRTDRREVGGTTPGLRSDDTVTRSQSLSTGLKSTTALADTHSLVVGAEVEHLRRGEQRSTLFDGAPVLGEFGDNLRATSTRWALYAQDEWSVSKQVELQLGLRGEGIATRGSGEGGDAVRNRSTVWTPLLHAVWRPAAQRRDQVRLSLTRSYRSPTLQNLIARPWLNTSYPDGPNEPTQADRAGNPALRPEIATGIDLAVERYLPGGGLLSANLFHRRIQDLMRTVTTLEAVSWADAPRWVARPRNIGDATTTGIEMEARFRLDDLLDGAPGVDLRSNLSLFRSRVQSVPGPDNRLDQQPDATANLGADYKLANLPLTVGANLNWAPGYDARLAEDQYATQNRKRVFDAYALWRVQPGMQLRLSAGNLVPLDDINGSTVFNEVSRTAYRSTVSWQIQLEMKL